MFDNSIKKFTNCYILRDNEIIKEDLWVRCGKIINPEPLFFEEKVIEKQELNILANQSQSFLSSCDNKESLIFKKRINCKEKITLDELSKVLNISVQRINCIEKTLYEKFVNFCKSNIENKKIADKG